MPQRVLITGATGGLGLALVQAFSHDGYVVTATGRSEEKRKRLESRHVKFIAADLRDPDALTRLCKDQDMIIHAAALSASWGRPEDFYMINVTVTENILRCAKASGCSSLIYISTPSIYAAMRDQHNLTEQSPVASPPLNNYARTKLLAERFVLSQDCTDFKTLAIRPRAIVGPDDKVLLPKILEMIRNGKLPVFRDGKAEIELTDVRDVANATLLAAKKMDQLQGQAINISGGCRIAVRELAEKIASAAKYDPRYINIPMPVAKVLAPLLEWYGAISGYKHEPRLTRYTLATLAYSQTFDMTLAKEKLGYVPIYDPLATILEYAGRGIS